MKTLLCFLVMFYSISAYAEDERSWTVSLDQAVLDKYMFRGLVLNREGVYQGILDLSYDTGDLGTVGINLWSNADLDNENSEAGNFTEVDYALYWSKSFDSVTLTLGYVYYDFSMVELGSTKEVYAAVSLDVLLAPTIIAYYDFEDVDGTYLDFGISHSFDLGILGASLDVGANLGWADSDMSSYYYAGSDSGFTNYTLSAGIDIPLMDNVIFTPSVIYYTLIEEANEKLTGTVAKDNDFVYSVNLNISF